MVALATAYVKLRLDASDVKNDVDRGLKRAGGERAARLKGQKISAEFSKGFGDGSSTIARVASVMAARMTIATAAVSAATPAVIQFAAAVAPAAGVAAALPAVLSSIAVASAATKVAVRGVGDAITAGFGDNAAQAAEEMGKLSGEARTFATRITALREPLGEIQRATANTFFGPLNDEIRPLAQTYLPLLRRQLPETAAGVGGLAERFMQVARTAPVVRTVNAVFDETQDALFRVKAAVAPVVTAIANGIGSTVPAIGQVADGFTRLALRTADWINEGASTGRFMQWIKDGVTTVKQMVQIFGDLGAITRGVFASATTGSASLLQRIQGLTGEVREFVESAEGMQIIADTFRTMGVFGAALRTALGGVLPEIGAALRISAPAAAELASALAALLVSLGPLLPALAGAAAVVVRTLVPGIEGLAGWLERNEEILRVIAPLIVGYVVAMKLAAAAALGYKVAVMGVIAVTKAWAAAQAALAFVQLAGQVRSLGDAWSLLGTTMSRPNSQMAIARGEMAKLGPTADKATGSLGKMAKGAGVAGAAIAALQIASATMGSSVNPQLDAMAVGLNKFATTGKQAGESARVFGEKSELLDQALHDLGQTGAWASFVRGAGGMIEGITGIGNAYDKSLQHSKERLAALSQELAGMVKAGNGQQAAAIFEQVAKRAAEQGVKVETLRKLLPEYTAAMETTSGAAKKLSTDTNTTTGATGRMKTASDAAKTAVIGHSAAIKGLTDRIRAQFDPVVALVAAQKDFKVKQDAAAEAVRKHGARSKEARAASLDLASAAIDLTSKTGALGDKFNGKLTPAMIKVFRNAGLTKTQIGNVATSFQSAKAQGDKYAKTYAARATLNDNGVGAKLASYVVLQTALKRGISMGNARAIAGDTAAARDRKLFATGGKVPGYSPNSRADNIPAMLTAGEFVLPVDSVKHYGAEFMEAIRKRKLPRGAAEEVMQYASGGVVMPYPVRNTTRIPSRAEVIKVAMPAPGSFGKWPSSPQAQRGDSGVWRKVVQLIKSAGTGQGSFGNAYRPGDPKWHGSGRAVDWMGYNMDKLASFLAARRPLELIHRTNRRDYAYTRGKNKGSFSSGLMNAHRNHIHIAMAMGGLVEKLNGLNSLGPVKLMDRGGTLDKGFNAVYNGTGKPERLVREDHVGQTVILNNYGVIGSQAEMDAWLLEGLRRLKRARKTP